MILVDKQDKHLLADYSWSIHKHGYPHARVNGEVVRIHQLIMPAKDGYLVDHINGDKLDNRRSNLRYATVAQNQYNRKVGQKNNKSGYKGVWYREDQKKYRALIRFNNKLKHLGQYKTAEEAAEVYNNAAKSLFGDYARLNEIT